MKIIKLYYQDCPDCGRRKEWATAQSRIATENDLEIRKVSFTEAGADEVIRRAYSLGITVPFFTDGETFAKDLSSFAPGVEKSAEAVVNACPVAKKKSKKNKKAKAEGENADPVS